MSPHPKMGARVLVHVPHAASLVAGAVGLRLDVGLTVGVVLALGVVERDARLLPSRLGEGVPHELPRWVVLRELPVLVPQRLGSAGNAPVQAQSQSSSTEDVQRLGVEAPPHVLQRLDPAFAVAVVVVDGRSQSAVVACDFPGGVRDGARHGSSSQEDGTSVLTYLGRRTSSASA